MRRTARENAFKLLFERSVSGGTGDITYAVLTRSMAEEENDYFNLLISGVNKSETFIGDVIKRYARGFDFDRIYKIDRAILQIAIYEILFLGDVPDKVAVNEALEMSKIYSTDNSPSFINGILASVIREKAELTDEYKKLAEKKEESNPEQCDDCPEDCPIEENDIVLTEVCDDGENN